MSTLSRFRWLLGAGRGSPAAGVEVEKEIKKSSDGDDDEFGVTEELKALIRGFTAETFKSYPISTSQDEELGDGVSKVWQDLTDWQEHHAVLALSKVKELAQLRYRLCPGRLKEAQFWSIYFLLVKNHTAPYEIRALQKQKLKAMELEEKKGKETAAIEVEMTEAKQISKGFIAYNEL